MSFHSTFYAIGKGVGFAPDAWAPWFAADRRAAWSDDESGSLIHTDADGRKRALIVEFHSDHGWSISYDLMPVRGGPPGASQISVGDAETMDRFVRLPNGAMRPEGSFVSASGAETAVRAFLTDPMSAPAGIDWQDAATLNWPESL